MPLVSILTPTYNQAHYLVEAIQSVLAQTFEDWEQIIIDDGSDDKTPESVKRFRDERIKYLRLPHRGLGRLAESYNLGLDMAQGRFIAILDGDDYWPADKLERQVKEFLDDEEVFLVWGRGTVVNARRRYITQIGTVNTRKQRCDFSPNEIFKILLRKNILIPTATIMLRRDSLLAVGGFNQKGTELYVDLPTWLVLMANVEGKIRFLNHHLGYWRNHPSQTTRLNTLEIIRQHQSVVKEIKETLPPPALKRMLPRPSYYQEAENYLQGILNFEKGKLLMASAEFSGARSSFSDVLRSNLEAAYKLKAVWGLLTASFLFNVVSLWRSGRDKLGAC